MKYNIKFTSRYKKDIEHIRKRGYDLNLLDEVVEQLACGEPLGAKYKDHALRGFGEAVRECHIRPDWLLVYLIEDDVLTLTLAQTGTHAVIFNL